MEKEKGMSHIGLILCIAIIIAIVVCVLFFVKQNLQKEVLKMYETDMLLIQGKVKVLSNEAVVKSDKGTFIGRKIEESLETEDVKSLLEKGVISEEEKEFSKYYIIDKQALNEMGLTDVKIREGCYIVNYSTGEVIYAKGVKIGENTYYKLSDIKEANAAKAVENEENFETVENEENMQSEE